MTARSVHLHPLSLHGVVLLGILRLQVVRVLELEYYDNPWFIMPLLGKFMVFQTYTMYYASPHFGTKSVFEQLFYNVYNL